MIHYLRSLGLAWGDYAVNGKLSRPFWLLISRMLGADRPNRSKENNA